MCECSLPHKGDLIFYNISATPNQYLVCQSFEQLTFVCLDALVHTRGKQFLVHKALVVFAHDLGIECHPILDEPLILADQKRQVRCQRRQHERHQKVVIWVEQLR